MSIIQPKKEDLNTEENKENDGNEKYLLFKEIKKKVYESNIKPEDRITVYGKFYSYYKNLNNPEIFSKNSQFVTFINEEIKFKKKYFIYNQKSLELALKEAQIKDAIVTNEEAENMNNSNGSKDLKESKNSDVSKDPNISKDSNDSNSSSQSSNSLEVENILEASNIVIKQDKSIKVLKIFSEIKFKNRFSINKVKDIDFNFKNYKDFPINKDSNFDVSKVNSFWHQEMDIFYNEKGTNSELIIFGPRGVGKSINILSYLNMANVPRLYFPIKQLIKLKSRKWKKIALNETIYILNSSSEIEEFKKYCNNIPDEQDLMLFIYKYIEFLFKFYEGKKIKKKILIVLDDYDDSSDLNNNIVNIENFVYKNNNQILLFILGHCQYIYEKYYNYILDKKQKYRATFWDLPFEEGKDLFEIPFYYYRYNNDKKEDKTIFEKNIKTEIIEDFKKIELKNFFSLSKYLNIFVNIKDLEKDFKYFPFEYLHLTIKNEKNDNFIKISFKLNIYKEVFLEIIKGLLKIDNIKSTFNLNKNDENKDQKDGMQFEDIIVEQLWNNSLGLYEYPEKNKIRINDIYSIKSYNGQIYNIEKEKNVIIRQTQFTGKFYDLLLIINYNGNVYGIFVQIGLNKKGIDIEQDYNNIFKYNDNYIKGIKNLINVEVNEIGFLLIFDYERQVILKKNNNKTQGVGYCEKENIAYIIYKDFQLYDNLESKDPITNITSIDLDNTLVFGEIKIPALDIFKNNYMDLCRSMISENNTPCISIEEEEKEQIIKYINRKYKSDFDELRFFKNVEKTNGFLDFGFFCEDFDQVNIIKADKKDFKYITYKNEIMKIYKSNELEPIKEAEKNRIQKTTDDNFEYDLYLLDKKRNRQNMNK